MCRISPPLPDVAVEAVCAVFLRSEDGCEWFFHHQHVTDGHRLSADGEPTLLWRLLHCHLPAERETERQVVRDEQTCLADFWLCSL